MSANTQASLDGNFKEVYADKMEDLRPTGVKLYNIVKFNESKKLGNLYHQPIILGYEHGFTYGGTSGAAFNLNTAIQAAHADCQVSGSELVLRSFLALGAASRSLSNKAAFVQATSHIVKNMLESYMVRLEAQLMYGQSGIAAVESVSGSTIVIKDAEWAPGLWAGSENMLIEVYNGSTKRGECKVVSVDFSAKSITVDAVPSGTTASDDLWHKGAYGNEFVGLHKVLSASSGTIFNINVASYGLFQGNTIQVGTDATTNAATMSYAKLEEGVQRAQEKGLVDEDVVVLCNPGSWKNLLIQLMDKRSYDQSYSSSKMDNGSKNIEFFGPNGKIEIVSSIFCKEGYAYMICPKNFKRIGSSDVTFNQPGGEGKFVRILENTHAYEFRCYSDQALFTHAPGRTAFFKFIKNA